jgi:hypothetical protein
MASVIRLKFEHGVFVPLSLVRGLKEGDIIEFSAPDPNAVYLCPTDRLAALESGRVIFYDPTLEDEGADTGMDALDG